MSFEVTIEPLGEVIEVEEGQTVLDALLRAGIYIPYQCGNGRCSSCKIDVLEGDVDHGDASLFALMDFERDEGKALACCATPLTDLVIEAEVDEDPDAEYLPIQDLTGTVKEIADLTPLIKKVVLDVGAAGLAFQAGQYVNLQIPDLEDPRAFSIASVPSNPARIELHIRKVEGGAATTHIHEALKVGDKLGVTGPFGRFFVRKSADVPVIFIAGGSGLSSPQSMIFNLLEGGFGKPVYLFHGVCSVQDLYHRELFEELSKKYDNLTYVPALSGPLPGDDWDGETGFIHEAAERHFEGKFAGHKAYLCGPPPMIEASIRALMKGRLFEKDIYTEKFVTQADGEEALAKSPLFRRI